MKYERWTPYIWFLITYYLLLPILESCRYYLLLLFPLICPASAFLMHEFQFGQPTYMFFHNVLNKTDKKASFCFLGFFKIIIKARTALFIGFVLQMCMSNGLLSQHRPSVKSVTRAVPSERSCRPDVHHTLCPKPAPRQRHWRLFHTGALPSLLLQKREPPQRHSSSCKIKYRLRSRFKGKGKQICCSLRSGAQCNEWCCVSLPTKSSADSFGCI